MQLNPDFKEFIALLNSEGVEFAIVGGFAVACHGQPRYTGDIDILVRVASDNADRLVSALRGFGFGSLGVSRDDFLKKDQVIQLGYAPVRIDLLTGLDGIDADLVLDGKIEMDLYGMKVPVIRREHLVQNKKALGRPRDLADLENLGEKV